MSVKSSTRFPSFSFGLILTISVSKKSSLHGWWCQSWFRSSWHSCRYRFRVVKRIRSLRKRFWFGYNNNRYPRPPWPQGSRGSPLWRRRARKPRRTRRYWCPCSGTWDRNRTRGDRRGPPRATKPKWRPERLRETVALIFRYNFVLFID